MIVRLSEVLVSYIPKFNLLHMALSFPTGIAAETTLTSVYSGVCQKKRSRHAF